MSERRENNGGGRAETVPPSSPSPTVPLPTSATASALKQGLLGIETEAPGFYSEGQGVDPLGATNTVDRT